MRRAGVAGVGRPRRRRARRRARLGLMPRGPGTPRPDEARVPGPPRRGLGLVGRGGMARRGLGERDRRCEQPARSLFFGPVRSYTQQISGSPVRPYIQNQVPSEPSLRVPCPAGGLFKAAGGMPLEEGTVCGPRLQPSRGPLDVKYGEQRHTVNRLCPKYVLVCTPCEHMRPRWSMCMSTLCAFVSCILSFDVHTLW